MTGGRAALILLAGLLLAPAAGAVCPDQPPPAKLQKIPPNMAGQTLDEITERGYIEFAVYADFPPYSWKAEGRARGVDIDLGTALAAALGVSARFNFVASGETVDEDLRNHVWRGPVIGGRVSNALLRAPVDPNYACRIEQAVLTGAYQVETLAIAYRPDAFPDGAPGPGDFRRRRIGVENDSIAEFYLGSLAQGAMLANIVRYRDYGAAMAGLAAGEVPAVMGPRGQLEHGLPDGARVHVPPFPGLAAARWEVGLGVRQTYRDLAYALDDAVAALIADGSLARIYAAYGLSYQPPARP